MTKKLEEMTMPELLEQESDAMLNLRDATQFNDDSGSQRLAAYASSVAAELERRGVCRGGLNDGCEFCL